ncbi:hypothetical protein A9K55_003016 [Cordyceps militaris]|uniref:Uncharacterized protein n=1 Tax=Cordyceps militaris TaxID=73501 RepID=A0A2H4S7F5_CORMI|nr:hypothetical protein A9K55_003016 [Cordyceps militaris]
MAPERGTYAAYCEDANEDTGSSVEGTRNYALHDEMPPPKNRPNVGTRIMTGSSKRASLNESDTVRSSAKSHRDSDARRDRPRPADPRRSSQQYDDSDREREHQRIRQERKIRESDARRSHGHSPKESSKKTRPTVQHGPPLPIPRGVADEFPRYAYQQPAVSSSRPRPASRSATYYDGQPYPPPPPAGMVWHHPPFPPGHFPPGPLVHPGHPGHPGHPMHFPPPMHDMPPRGMPPPSPMGMVPPGYFVGPPHPGYSDHLKARFEARPPSAMGALGGPERVPPGYSPDEYGDETAAHVMRRPSRPSRGEDRRMMPPPERMPQRAMSAAPQHSGPYRPPPGRPQVSQQPRRPSVNRHSVSFGDDDYDDYEASNELFQDLSPEPSYRQRRYAEPARPRRGSRVYESVDIIPAGRRNRKVPAYGDVAYSGPPRAAAKYETRYADAKIQDAQDYQDAVTGPKTPLTTEMLQKATRGNTGSQSTRSSGSRDDSEYRRSYTTGITRSSSGNGTEEVTIKFGEAELKFRGGADFTFNSRPQPPQIRSGSDKSSTVYQLEDGREQEREPPRMTTLPHRTRAPSHSEYRPRGYPSGTYSPYEHYAEPGSYI